MYGAVVFNFINTVHKTYTDSYMKSAVYRNSIHIALYRSVRYVYILWCATSLRFGSDNDAEPNRIFPERVTSAVFSTVCTCWKYGVASACLYPSVSPVLYFAYLSQSNPAVLSVCFVFITPTD